jgi:hypothetical protein
MADEAKETPGSAEADPGAKPAGEAGRRETPEQWARSASRAMLVKVLLNASRDFEQAAYRLGKW